MEELTTRKDLEAISQRIVDRVNGDLYSYVDLVISAYFTEFALT
jgi:hypothetical protein